MLTLLSEDQLENSLDLYKPFTLYQLQLEQRHRRSSLFLADHPEEHWLDILTGAKKGSPSNFTYENAEYILECELENNLKGLFVIEDILDAYYEESKDSYMDSYMEPNGSRFEVTENAINNAKENKEFSKEALEFLENTSKYQPKMRTGNITPWLENAEAREVIEEAYEEAYEYDRCNGVIVNESNGYLLMAKQV
tara:strand:+ start:937 stop:1521 length:585 start_codon:yes stop_codon:yes gene_type:complete